MKQQALPAEHRKEKQRALHMAAAETALKNREHMFEISTAASLPSVAQANHTKQSNFKLSTHLLPSHSHSNFLVFSAQKKIQRMSDELCDIFLLKVYHKRGERERERESWWLSKAEGKQKEPGLFLIFAE